jgi:hypothetical protein
MLAILRCPMNTQRNALLLGTIVLAVFCSSPSCVVGDAISLQYENTVSYFNAFYNARRLFSEAEDEIMASRWALRGKDLPATPAGIPSTAKAKLNLVIDKCSNILVFHSTSSYVDDALFLVGKSFFYQEEYLKADRKFEEMLSQYPTSSLHLEAE